MFILIKSSFYKLEFSFFMAISISYSNINSAQDVEKVLNNKEVEQKVSGILKSNHFNIEQGINCLDISDLFKITLTKSQGFKTCLEIKSAIEGYSKLLRKSLNICNDVHTSLLVRSFRCFQKALNYYESSQQKSSIDAMAETCAIAQEIGGEYEKLKNEFREFSQKSLEILIGLTKDQAVICKKARDIQERQKKNESLPSDLIEKSIIEANISSLDDAIKATGGIETNLKNLSMLWMNAKRASFKLDNHDVYQILIEDMSMDFEQSYLDLLVLAKINNVVVTAIRETIVKFEENLMEAGCITST